MASPHNYLVQALGATGFCVLDTRIAFELRPDLFASQQEALATLREPNPPIRGVHRVTAEISGFGKVLVLTRSMDRLAERISWVTGREVVSVGMAPPRPKAEATPTAATTAGAEARQRREKLRALAAEDLPAHECVRRKEILDARAEIEGDRHARA